MEYSQPVVCVFIHNPINLKRALGEYDIVASMPQRKNSERTPKNYTTSKV